MGSNIIRLIYWVSFFSIKAITMGTWNLMTGRYFVSFSLYSIIFLFSFGEMSLTFFTLWN